MGKPLVKVAAVVIGGVAAITVCFVGYKVNINRQYEQRVNYTETAVLKEKSSLKEIKEEIASLYSDGTHTFLKNDLQEEAVNKVETKLAAIKVSAAEFGINEEDLPENIKEVKAEKDSLDKRMDDADLKFYIQKSVNELFTQPVSDWQAAQNDVIINEQVSETTIGDIRDRLKMIADSNWKNLINQYLDYATAQVKRATDIQETLDKLLKDGKVASSATYEIYLNLVDSIAQVRNETLKKSFEEAAATIGNQIGVGAAEETTDTWTNTEELSQDYTQ
ncbi:hypothetical protein P7D40_07710 [Enterococcus dongliensis]|uniref:hypothetical protein n=1 Tax=Enterococcus dongliensis TaxID=2559925 RepID=UPI00288F94E5|nr:hypothetical protein [Enterococcus dongliensis]MDT2634775.1 hypothetical protein [Enterococcus dongliensis]MDT2669244.1 hypothetical protein [Enterococcus dongliensis]